MPGLGAEASLRPRVVRRPASPATRGSTPARVRSRRPARRPLRRSDRGQASVELALCLPVVALALLLVVQVSVVARAQVLVVHAAREAARAAAVGDRPPAPDGLDPARTEVEVEAAGGRAVVNVTYRYETDVPLVGMLLPDLDLRGAATMRVE